MLVSVVGYSLPSEGQGEVIPTSNGYVFRQSQNRVFSEGEELKGIEDKAIDPAEHKREVGRRRQRKRKLPNGELVTGLLVGSSSVTFAHPHRSVKRWRRLVK